MRSISLIFFWFSAYACGVGSLRTVLLIKTHTPTAAMVQRFCHLVEEAAATDFSFKFYFTIFIGKSEGVQARHIDPVHWQLPESERLLPDPTVLSRCPNNATLDVFHLDHDNYTAMWGPITGELLQGKIARGGVEWNGRWALSSIPELTFFAEHRDTLVFDHMWVIEHDVAWQGNLFDALATFSAWRDDYLCKGVGDAPPGTPWPWYDLHSGTFEFVQTRLRCQRFVARYSRRLMEYLVDLFLKQGHWADDEWFASTVCGRHLHNLTGYNCTVRDYDAAIAFADIFGDPFHFGQGGDFDLNRSLNYTITQPPKLFHPVKF